jgi:hypothetical protein
MRKYTSNTVRMRLNWGVRQVGMWQAGQWTFRRFEVDIANHLKPASGGLVHFLFVLSGLTLPIGSAPTSSH